MRGTDGKAKKNLKVTFFYGLLLKDVPVLTDQQELIYVSSVQT